MLCVVATALVVGLGTRLSFFNDDWYFLLQRPGLESGGGLDALLAPHNGNMVVVLAAVFKLLVAVFGIGSQWPFRLVLGLSWAGLGIVVYALVRARVGVSLAVLAAGLLLFLGPAWEVALFFSGINHLWALELGLASLLLLQRDTSARNAAACVLLTVAVASSNTGLALVAAAALAILTRRRARQLWIAGIPVAVYGLWWIGYGHSQSSGVTAGHIEALPGYVFDSLSSGLASLLGLNHGTLPALLYSGHLPAVVVLGGLAAWIARGGRPRAQALWFAGGLIVFWLLTGASATVGRAANSSRYQLTDVALMLVLAAELAHRHRVTRPAMAALGLAWVAIVASNLVVLHDGYAFLRTQAGFVAADTGALQIAGPRAPRDLWLLSTVAGDPYLSGITAGRYFAQTAAHGTPAFDTVAELSRAPAPQRGAADGLLIAAEQIHARLVPNTSARRECVTLNPPARARATAPVSALTMLVHNSGTNALALGLSRFGPTESTHGVAFLPGRATERLTFGTDRVSAPWRLTVIELAAVPALVAVCRS
jgi:hypothetical protein